jgi:hypothetical protein
MPKMKKAPICLRCGHHIPCDERPGAYPGAVSRTDNKTEVCSQCGTDEAMEHFALGAPRPQSQWPTQLRAKKPVVKAEANLRPTAWERLAAGDDE